MPYTLDDVSLLVTEANELIRIDYKVGVFIAPDTYAWLLREKKKAEEVVASGNGDGMKILNAYIDLKFPLDTARKEMAQARRPSSPMHCADELMLKLAASLKPPDSVKEKITPELRKEVLRDIREVMMADVRVYTVTGNSLSSYSQQRLYALLESKYKIGIPADEKEKAQTLIRHRF